MFHLRKTQKPAPTNGDDARFRAIGRSQAVIEFELDGTIVSANENFLKALGYDLSEIVGRHHSMFVDPAEAGSDDYRQFWRKLNAGEFVATKFRRLAKGAREIWIQASYNPILDATGTPIRVIKIASDITESEQRALRNEAERQRSEKVQGEVVSILADRLSRLSQGDLQVRIEELFEGSYVAIRDDFNRAAETLEQAISTIATSTGAVKNGADEIASAANDLSKRTEQQAAALEQTAAALDQVTATVKKSAEGAREAAARAEDSRSEATTAGEVVREAVGAMSQIDDSARQISQIIGVIDEIAFQTNLLALNAGVEAARAGEAGRGFAVVAQEVRALAQRAADAAKEIKALIATSGQHVGRGVNLVGATGKALEALVERASVIANLVQDIARASQEQATGLGEINTAINQMDQVTQQNAAMVEETTAAATQLQTQSAALSAAVGRFRVELASNPSPIEKHSPLAERKLRAVAGGRQQAVWEDF
jgi:methyl-accepting chemotaxis protein